MDLASEFYRIFAGNKRAHGEYVIKGQKGSKITGKAITISSPPTEDLWRKHLAGEIGIGIVPITEENTCSWGAVDVDVYDDLDIEEWSMKIPSPFIVMRSKSGGAHVYIFTQVPVNTALMQKKLSLLARSLGHANAEIFPKQGTLNEGDIGNWINMPYFAGEKTMRYAIKGGVILSPEEFINCVSESALSIQQLVSLQIDSIFDVDTDPEFEDAPPCLQYLVKHGFPPGTRNSALFSMGVFARMKFGAGWEDKTWDYNNRFMGPGTYSEVAGIIRSLQKKSYVYKCKDQPLLSVCDKEACAECQYGIQPNKDDERNKRPCVLDLVTKVKLYEPPKGSKDDPYWVFSFDNADMDVTVDMTRSQAMFTREFTRQFYEVILPIKDNKWSKSITNLINPKFNPDLELHQLAPDAGPEGQMWVHLEEFCTNKAKAKVKEEMILGKPWHEDSRTYFRSSDFMKYLDQQRFRSFKESEIFRIIKGHGAKHHQIHLKGKNVKCWSITSFDEQNEPFDQQPLSEDEY